MAESLQLEHTGAVLNRRQPTLTLILAFHELLMILCFGPLLNVFPGSNSFVTLAAKYDLSKSTFFIAKGSNASHRATELPLDRLANLSAIGLEQWRGESIRERSSDG